MPEPRGVHCRRLERTRGQPPPARLVAAGILHAAWQADLRGSSGHGDAGQGAGEAVAEVAAARGRQDATRRSSSTEQPVRMLVLSRVHWVRPEMVVEVSYLTW